MQGRVNHHAHLPKEIGCSPSSGPREHSRQTQRKRISRTDTLKWTFFVLLVSSVVKLEVGVQVPSHFMNHNQTSEAVDVMGANGDPLTNSTTTTTTTSTSLPKITHAYNDRKIVLLPGPHKSASTSVQVYLVGLAKEGILRQYNWEWIGKESSKGFSDMARQLLFEPEVGTNDRKVLIQKDMAQEKWDAGNNLVIAAEFMDYVAALSEEEARKSIGRLWDWLPKSSTRTNNVQTVVMYRSPRASHLISAWKQQVQFHKASSNLPWRESLDERHRPRKKFHTSPTLAEWLCNGVFPRAMKYNVETILSAQLNPFGVAYAYHKHGGANVTMVDMMGVPDGDIPSIVVCNVLGLPCTAEGKLAVESKVMSSQKNHKSERAELGMTNDYLEEAEVILRDMDCFYYCVMGESVDVLHGSDVLFADGKMSWEKCCERNKGKETAQLDGKWMARRLIQLGCRALEESQTTEVLSKQG